MPASLSQNIYSEDKRQVEDEQSDKALWFFIHLSIRCLNVMLKERRLAFVPWSSGRLSYGLSRATTPVLLRWCVGAMHARRNIPALVGLSRHDDVW